jgi:hypothetical protein
MVDIKDQPDNLESAHKKLEVQESGKRFEHEEIKSPENIKVPEKEDRIISAELRREIEMMQLEENTKAEAEAKAEKISFLGEKEKLEKLLEIARHKGVIYAIHMAKKMNEPYLLDLLHDTLASEGFYKDFTK